MVLKRKQTPKSHFCLISFTTIVGCNMCDCHCRKSLKLCLFTWIKWFILYLSRAVRVTACCCSWSVCFPYFLPRGPTRKDKMFVSWEACEWRNPNPSSARPVPCRGWAHLVLWAPACRGAACTTLVLPVRGVTVSVLAGLCRWRALPEQWLV